MNSFSFQIEATSWFARAGIVTTPHGSFETPVFMPVGTQATIKWLTWDHLDEIKAQICLANTYHLMLRPSPDVVEGFGGLHEFTTCPIPMLTDSGGFQVFSLGKNGGKDGEKKDDLVKIDEDGVSFRSHLDGSKYRVTPEKAIQIQSKLGADIIMAFDECAAGGSSISYAKAAMNRTHRWLDRCVSEWTALKNIRSEQGLHPQALFGIIQWVVYDDLRRESAKYIRDTPVSGIAIGGLSVGESKEDMYRTLDVLAPELAAERPHYLMGVGTPEDLIEGIARGVDMFDCVLPTRLARHGVAFSSEGNMNLMNEKYRLSKDHIPTEDDMKTSVSQRYSLGYLRHMYKVGESTAWVLISMHNLEYLILLAQSARKAILTGTFDAWYARMKR